MKHRRYAGPSPARCTTAYHRGLPARKMEYIGEQPDAEGYPPMRLYNCRRCRTTVARARPGRCDGCNELVKNCVC